ncbi:MAG TPA: hypothetical protein VM848_17155 [Acidimicrobiia bacterium]|nr:hypothetical protein [Acidimicrobiia bacterium]
MNDTADPSSRRYRFNARVLLSCAIFALSVLLVPAYVAMVGVATIGETEATTHVETTEAVADPRSRHKQRRRTVSKRKLWYPSFLPARRDGARRHRRQGGRLRTRPWPKSAPTRAPPAFR